MNFPFVPIKALMSISFFLYAFSMSAFAAIIPAVKVIPAEQAIPTYSEHTCNDGRSYTCCNTPSSPLPPLWVYGSGCGLMGESAIAAKCMVSDSVYKQYSTVTCDNITSNEGYFDG